MKRFGQSLRQTLIGFTVLCATLIACNREPATNNVSGDVKVRIPFPVEGGGYALQVIALSGIKSMYEFSGDFANFYIYPSTDGSKIRGFRPKAHFIKSGDVYVPAADDQGLTQQMAVIYAHMQRLTRLDQELGVGELDPGPIDIGLLVRFPAADHSGVEVNNAFYNSDTDAILILPYTARELPIAVNGGILAHEHFHSLYYKLVGKVVQESMQAHGQKLKNAVEGTPAAQSSSTETSVRTRTLAQKTNLFFYLGLNEGLADFWASVYTGDPDFIVSSVPSEQAARTMKVDVKSRQDFRFSPAVAWKEIARRSFADECDGPCVVGRGCSIYCLGTEYARGLSALAQVVQDTRGITGIEARKLVAKAMLKALPQLALTLKDLTADEFYEPVNFLSLIGETLPDIKSDEKNFIAGVTLRSQQLAKAVSGQAMNPAVSVPTTPLPQAEVPPTTPPMPAVPKKPVSSGRSAR